MKKTKAEKQTGVGPRTPYPKRDKLINLRVTQAEYDRIRVKARLHANGSFSAWIRYAATELDPKRLDMAGLW